MVRDQGRGASGLHTSQLLISNWFCLKAIRHTVLKGIATRPDRTFVMKVLGSRFVPAGKLLFARTLRIELVLV